MLLNSMFKGILGAIATGHSYEQIVNQGIAETYLDIFRAATEAIESLKIYEDELASWTEELTAPDGGAFKAGTKWSPEDEQQLVALFESGALFDEICKETGRTPGGVFQRLEDLNLISRPAPASDQSEQPTYGRKPKYPMSGSNLPTSVKASTSLKGGIRQRFSRKSRD